MKRIVSLNLVLVLFILLSEVCLAQTSVTGLPSQWPNIVHFDCIEFNAGNRMYIGGRSSEGFISWNAYPDDPNGDARFRYSAGTTSAQIVFPNWANQMQFKFSTNTPTYGSPVAWSTTMVLTQAGRVGIGTTNPMHRLHVSAGDAVIDGGNFEVVNSGTLNFKVRSDGFVWARQFEVLTGPIPDYVFSPDYKLMPLKELRSFVALNHHLPGIKSESEYKEAGGINVGELPIQLLEKVEELTLYILELESQLQELEARIEELDSNGE